MESKKQHYFGEQEKEFWYGKTIPVTITSAYKAARETAIRIIDENPDFNLEDSDFWILKNADKTGANLYYTSLIISHDGVRKINAGLPEEKRFNPYYLTKPETRNPEMGTGQINLVKTSEESWMLTYCAYPDATHSGQELFMIAEINQYNLKLKGYPFAMLQKRLFDRVVLDLSGLGYGGIMGEDEADDFKKSAEPEKVTVETASPVQAAPVTTAPKAEAPKPVTTAPKKAEAPVNAANQVSGMKPMPTVPHVSMALDKAFAHRVRDNGIPALYDLPMVSFLKGKDGSGVKDGEKAINTLKIIMNNSSDASDRAAAKVVYEAYKKDKTLLVVRKA